MRTVPFIIAHARIAIAFAFVFFGAAISATGGARAEPPAASGVAGSPVGVVDTVVSLTDRHILPSWDKPDFSNRMRPYLTRDFITAVEHGRAVARRKQLNIWDGDLITGAQGLVRAKLWSVKIVRGHGDSVVAAASVSTSDTDATPIKLDKPNMRYWLEKEDGAWKIDDLELVIDLDQLGPEVRRDLRRQSRPTAKRRES